MEDHSMRATLAAQAQLIWPFERGFLPEHPGRVLDLGCGTGEFLKRIRAEFDCDIAVGVDLFAGHLRFAESLVAQTDGHRLPFADGSFDLVVVRHLLQAIPDPVSFLVEALRVLAKGGRIHVLAEDYMGIFFDTDDALVENHFPEVQPLFRAHGTDLYQGRRARRHLAEAGFSDITVQPLMVDNLTGDRDAFASVFRAWGEGYAETLAGLTGRTVEEMRARFVAMEQNVLDPDRYCAWLLFALGARKA
jgi:ubiquinone/menaquinone biosynthesis C-methylase UbiE